MVKGRSMSKMEESGKERVWQRFRSMTERIREYVKGRQTCQKTARQTGYGNVVKYRIIYRAYNLNLYDEEHNLNILSDSIFLLLITSWHTVAII